MREGGGQRRRRKSVSSEDAEEEKGRGGVLLRKIKVAPRIAAQTDTAGMQLCALLSERSAPTVSEHIIHPGICFIDGKLQ